MISIVLDTNILVAGLASNKGASYRILNAIAQGRVSPLLTVPLFLEYEAVLSRPDILELTGFTLREIREFLDGLIPFSTCIDRVWYLWRPLLPDPNDEMIVECAISGCADYIVTFNVKDFSSIQDLFLFQIVTPQEFLRILKKG